jgi:hypothetical protein
MKLRQWRGTPTFVLMRRGTGANGHTPLAARDEIECPGLPSLQTLIKHRVTASLKVLGRLPPVSSSLLASVVDSDGCLCTLNHAQRLSAFIQMQNTFAGIKPYCDVCSPITQTTRLLTDSQHVSVLTSRIKTKSDLQTSSTRPKSHSLIQI